MIKILPILDTIVPQTPLKEVITPIVKKQPKSISKTSFNSINALFNLYYFAISTLNMLPVKFCKYDTPEIKSLRKNLLSRVYKSSSTTKVSRDQVVKKIFDEQQNISKTGNFYLVLGLSGSGKSTYSKKLASEKHAFPIDIDTLCFKLPEVEQDHRNYYAYFLEGNKLKHQVLELARKEHYDIVFEDIGLFSGELLKICKIMKENGYKIHLRLVELPLEKTIQRLMERYNETKRFIDPLFNCIMKKRPQHTYSKLISKTKGIIDSSASYSSDVAKNEDFKLISSSEINP